jgi:Ca-activated chloride channel family protein
MTALRDLRLVLAFLLFAILAYLVLINPRKAAAESDELAVHDGTPSERACAELGFTQRADYDDGGGRMTTLDSVRPLSIAPAPQVAGETYRSGLAGQSGTTSKSISNLLGSMLEQPVDTERYPDATPNPIKTVGKDPVSTFSIDVDTASYSNVRRFLNAGHLPPRDAVRVEELVNYFDYGYARPESATEPFRAHFAVTASPWAPGREIVHIGLQGYEIASAERKPLNLVFLVDVSGSMDDPAKLPLAQKALNILIDQLQPQDQVALAVYAGAAGAVLAPTSGNQKLKLRCGVNALQAGGSTAGGEGLALAYSMAEQAFDKASVNRVILLSDGDFNVGIADPEKLEDFVAEKRRTGVYLSVYGFGGGNYNDVMMQTLSQAGNGTAAYVDTLKEARKLFHDDFSGSLFPIADDVKIQVEFNPARVAEYRLIGYETRLLNREDFNNDAVDSGEVGSGVSVTALYEITPVGGPLANDLLRYQDAVVPASDKSGELAFLKIRYKLPGEETSRLMETPIGEANRVADAAAAPEATRWALAVAAYGQKLRGDPYMAPSFGWDRIMGLAQGARGEDPFGIRAEFVQLVRAAETAKSVNE